MKDYEFVASLITYYTSEDPIVSSYLHNGIERCNTKQFPLLCEAVVQSVKSFTEFSLYPIIYCRLNQVSLAMKIIFLSFIYLFIYLFFVASLS